MLLIILIVFIFGCFIGSFLNCVVYRMENKKSFAKGRSFCPKCKHTLAWSDLIPVISFLFLRGKCRYCKKKISWQYPVVEIITGLLFLLIFNQFSILEFSKLLYLLVVSCLLEVIFIYDLKHYIIPDRVIFPAIIIVFLFRILDFIRNFKLEIRNYDLLLNLTMAIVVSAGFFFLLWLISRGRWMGFGDVKLALFMGLFLSWPNILVALFFAFILGSVIGLILIALQKKKMKSQMPFGPFLIAGTFVGLFWGTKIINWYLNLIY